VKKLIAVIAAFAAMILLVSTVSAMYGDPPSETSYPAASTFAGAVYTGGVCGISYRLIFSDDGSTFVVRGTEPGIDTAKGTVKEVSGRVGQVFSKPRVAGEAIINRIELDSFAYQGSAVYQLMTGNFDDATGLTATLTLNLWDFRPGHEWCVDELTISRE
jgi:hypothetical protein